MDIRRATVVIVRKNDRYLCGRILYSDEMRWSPSPYDAWRTRDRQEAEQVARAVGGITMLFNPVARQLRIF